MKDWAGKESRMTLGFWPEQPERRVATDQYREGCKLTGLRAGGQSAVPGPTVLSCPRAASILLGAGGSSQSLKPGAGRAVSVSLFPRPHPAPTPSCTCAHAHACSPRKELKGFRPVRYQELTELVVPEIRLVGQVETRWGPAHSLEASLLRLSPASPALRP